MVENTLLYMFMNEEKLAMDESDDKITRHLKKYKKCEEDLLKTLNREQIEFFKDFRHHFLYHILGVRDRECSRIIFECLKIGMEFQKHLSYKDEERGDPVPFDG